MSDTFTFGPTLRLRENNTFSVETWRDRWTDALAEALWGRGPVYEVVLVDQERGIITLQEKS